MNKSNALPSSKSADEAFESSRTENVSLLQEDQPATLWYKQKKGVKKTAKNKQPEARVESQQDNAESIGAEIITETAPLSHDAEANKSKEAAAAVEDQFDAKQSKTTEETATKEDQFTMFSMNGETFREAKEHKEWNRENERKEETVELAAKRETKNVIKEQKKKKNKPIINKEDTEVVSSLVWNTINDLKQQIKEIESGKTELIQKTAKQERQIIELRKKTEEQGHEILKLEQSKNALEKKLEEQIEGVEKTVDDMESQMTDFEMYLANINEENGTQHASMEQFENELQETSSLPQDTFSFMLCSKLWSIPFWLGFGIFGLQVVTYSLLAADLLSQGGNNPLGLPANVKIIVRVTQVIALIVAIITQDDFRESIGQLSERHAISRIVDNFHDSTATKWWLSWSCRLVEGVLGLVVTLFLIVEVDSVFDILLNFTAMGFVASLDNLAFLLACRGIFGNTCLSKAEEIKRKTYPCEKRKPCVSQLLLFLTTVAMFLGWLMVVSDQIQGKYLCETIHVEFSDNVVIDLGGFSGFYVLQKSRNIGGHVEYVHNKSKGKFSYGEQAWIFSSGESPFQWEARSADTDSFDLLDTLDSPWVAEETNSSVDVQLDYIKLTCFECDTTSAADGCKCDSGHYGVYCEWKEPCRKLEMESFSEGSFGARIWSVEYVLLEGFHNSSIQAYNRPIYIGTKHDEDESEIDLLFFCGRRWVLTHTGAFEPLKNITALYENGSNKKLGLIWKDIADYFLDGFHIYDLTPKAISYISESTLSSETPIGLRWYDAKYSEDASESSALPLPDLNHPANFVLTCSTCKNEGIWLANKTCQCIHRASGDHCEIAPLKDGVCDPHFNIGDHDFDGGDCCAATCSAAACGEELTSTFVSEVSSSNNIFSANAENHLSGFQQCQDPSLVPVTIVGKNAEYVELKCGKTMILNTTLDADSSFTISGLRLRVSVECKLKVSGLKSQRYGYAIYPDDTVSNIAVNLRYGYGQGEEDVYLMKRCLFTDLHAAGATITSSEGDPSGKAVRWINMNTECGERSSIVQRYAITVMYYSMGVENVPNSWLNAETHECEWRPGIACSLENVTSNITLSHIGLNGQIPMEIGLLSGLRQLHLSNNLLSGTIPAAIGSLSQLEVLHLNDNKISGSTPCALCFLEDLVIDCEKIQCPPGCECNGKDNKPCTSYVNPHALEWGRNTDIDDFCEYNSIQRYAMVVLYHALGIENLTNSLLKGEKHECSWEFGIECNSDKTVTAIDLGNKGLRGFIPSEIGLLSGLLHLDLSSNLLFGTVPTEIANLSHLRVLRLNGNNIDGPTPCTLCHNFSLYELVLDCERITCAPGCFCSGMDSDNIVSPCTSYVDSNALAWGQTNAINDFCDYNSVQRYAMVVIYYAFGVENISNTWLKDEEHECLWAPGIKCDSSNVVTEINLEEKQLVGYIPTEIGLLSGLERLHLSNNQITGGIPSQSAALTKMRVLSLSDNQLKSTIPTQLTRLTGLGHLYLNNNSLSGTIPTDIANLSQLQVLRLNGNNVTGTTPCTLCHNFALQELTIDCDKITCMPGCFCNGTDYEDALFSCTNYVDSNALAWGRTNERDAFCQFNSVQRYAMVALYYSLGIEKISNTWLNDTTHECFWEPGVECDSENRVITRIHLLGDGGLIDNSPSCMGQAGDCEAMEDSARCESLSGCRWTPNVGICQGFPVPCEDITGCASCNRHGGCTFHDIYGVYSNGTCTPEAEIIVATAGGKPHRAVFEIAKMADVMAEIGDKVEDALVVPVDGDTQSNSHKTLLASIPPDIGLLVGLESLILYDSQLINTIPTQIGRLTNLERLVLNKNQLKGKIPFEIGRLTQLQDLDLSNNLLTGAIPSETAALFGLQFLYFNNNQLTGKILSEIAAFSKLEVLSLGDNQFTGVIPANITRLAGLEEVRLERNLLTGVIPPMIGSLSNLSHVSLNNNYLNGTIPAEINDLSQLRVLHLYGNNVAGAMPHTFCDNFDLIEIVVDCEKIFCLEPEAWYTYNVLHGERIVFADYKPFCTELLLKSDWTEYQNEYNETLDVSSKMNNGANTTFATFCGISSEYSNDREDRRFRFKLCLPKEMFLQIDPVGSSESRVECPENSAVTRLISFYNSEDAFGYYECLSFEGWITDDCLWTEWVTTFNAKFDFECGDQHVISGIESQYNSEKKDSLFKFKCCRLWRQVHD